MDRQQSSILIHADRPFCATCRYAEDPIPLFTLAMSASESLLDIFNKYRMKYTIYGTFASVLICPNMGDNRSRRFALKPCGKQLQSTFLPSTTSELYKQSSKRRNAAWPQSPGVPNFAYWITRNYRRLRMFACTVFFNHESPRRGETLLVK